MEIIIIGFLSGRFSQDERLRNKAAVLQFMLRGQKSSDKVGKIVIKLLGNVRHCLQDFEDSQLTDVLFFLSASRGVSFSSKMNRGRKTVLNWPEWKKLPEEYRGVKIYTS